MQLKPERRDNLQDGGQFRVTARRKSLIETFASESSFTCNLCHAFGTSNITQGSSHQSWISIFQSGFKIGRHVFTTCEMIGWIPDGCFGFGHLSADIEY